ncbi:MAG: ISAzo13 family transposase [Burkholderiaceae bacterium]|nr:ISAzo13 family transposase [Burkholderiaceae bacterium]
MSPDDDLDPIRARFEKLAWTLDERMRRLFAAAEASVLGHGGVSKVARAVGVSRRAIHAGLLELSALTGRDLPEQQRQRVRKEGGGRKSMRATDAALLAELKKLVEAPAECEPDAPLRWTCKSLRTLAAELGGAGFPLSHLTVGNLLGQLGYNLQPNRKLAAGADHPDRNAQFAFINHQVVTRLLAGDPVIALDTRKKERSGARDRRDGDGAPELVRAQDFGAGEAGEMARGLDDADGSAGWLGVARDHETASFAVESIRRWWHTMGRQRYPGASELMIATDGGAGGGRRVRLWKLELQRLADEIRLPIHVSHLPPATNKWNKIEHRQFSSVSMSWRGRPMVRHEVTINLIAGTITRKGLRLCDAAGDGDDADAAGEARFEHVHLTRSAFHGEWNYRIDPELAA